MVEVAFIPIPAVIQLPLSARCPVGLAGGAFASPRGFLLVSLCGLLRIFSLFAFAFAFGGRTGGPFWTSHRRSVPEVACVSSGTLSICYPLLAVDILLVFLVSDGLGS